MTKDFYIFRHGQSTYNIAGRTQGRTNDSVLTAKGEEQAANVGQRLKGKGIQQIITSPLIRAQQTAQIANQSLNVPIVTDDHFIEVDVGVVEGWHFEDIRAKYSEIFEKMHTPGDQDENACYPQGESKKQVRQRIFEGLENLVKNDKMNTVAVSSHGIMLAQTLVALGQSAQEIPNGAILHIRKQNKQWEIVEWIK